MVEVEEIKRNIPAQMHGKWVTVRNWLRLADPDQRIKTASCGSFASYQQEESARESGVITLFLMVRCFSLRDQTDFDAAGSFL